MLSEHPWKPESVMRYMLVLFASIMLGVVVVDLTNSRKWVPIDSKLVTLVLGTFSFHGVALVLAHQLLKEHDMSWSSAFGFRAPRLGRTVMLSTVVGILTLPIVWSLGHLSARIMTTFHFEPVAQETVQTLQSSVPIQIKLMIGLFAVVIAPIGEEVIFRGILYPAVKQQGFPRLALWGTALLFAVIHSNAMILLPLTFLAVILTLLYETTGNLLAPIITHSLFNFANFFWLVSQPASR